MAGDEHEIGIKVTVDASKAKKDLEEVADKTEEVSDKAEESGSKWETFADKLGTISPSFKKLSDSWQEASKKIDDNFGKSTIASKAFKLGVVGALAGIALKAGQVAWQFAKDTAMMFDPQGYSQAAGAMQKSIRKLKTSIGSLTAPLVNTILKGVSKIADGLTWIVERVRQIVAFIQGFIQPVVDAIGDAFWSIVDAIKSAINGLSTFLGFGEVFKSTTKSAKGTADAVDEIVEATTVGLASFDKLNTIDITDTTGDAEESEKIAKSIAKAKEDGSELASKIKKWFEGLNVGKVWDDFKKGCGEAYDQLCKTIGDWWESAKRKAGEIWTKFKTGVSEAWDKIVSTIKGWADGLVQWATDVWTKFKTGVSEAWDKIVEKLKGWFDGLLSWGTNVWNGFKTGVQSGWNKITTTIKKWTDGLLTWGTNVWNGFKTGITEAKAKLDEKLTGWFTGAKQWAKDIWSNFKQGVNEAKDKIVEKLTGWFDGLLEWGGDVWAGLTGGIGDVVSTLADTLGGWFNGFLEWGGDVWDSLTDGVNDVVTTVSDTVGDWFDGFLDWGGDVWDSLTDGVNDVVTTIGDTVGAWFNGFLTWGSSVWSDLTGGISGALTALKNGLDSWFSGKLDWAGDLWDKFVNAIVGIKARVENAFTLATSGIKGIFEKIWNTIADLFNKYVIKSVETGINALIKAYNKVNNLWGGKDIDLINISSSSSNSSSSTHSGMTTEQAQAFAGWISEAQAKGFTQDQYDGIVATIQNAFANDQTAYNEAMGVLNKYAPSFATSGSSPAEQSHSSTSSTATTTATTKSKPTSWEDLGPVGQGLFDEAVEQGLGEPDALDYAFANAGWAANGAAIAPNDPKPYILGDNTREFEVVSPVSLLDQTMSNVLTRFGFGPGGQNQNIKVEAVVELDGRVLARHTFDDFKAEARRRGTTI